MDSSSKKNIQMAELLRILREDELDRNSELKLSLAKERGTRIRMARVLSGLSRQEFQDQLGVSTSTLNAWENGRICLTDKGALRISKALADINIVCDVSWLLEGIGKSPVNANEKIKDFTTPMAHLVETQKIVSANRIFPNQPGDAKNDEVDFFLNNNANSVGLRIDDNKMSPIFDKGDKVCGIIIPTKYYNDFCSKPVILSYRSQLIVRKLIGIKHNTLYFNHLKNEGSNYEENDFLALDMIDINYIARVLLIKKILD